MTLQLQAELVDSRGWNPTRIGKFLRNNLEQHDSVFDSLFLRNHLLLLSSIKDDVGDTCSGNSRKSGMISGHSNFPISTRTFAACRNFNMRGGWKPNKSSHLDKNGVEHEGVVFREEWRQKRSNLLLHVGCGHIPPVVDNILHKMKRYHIYPYVIFLS